MNCFETFPGNLQFQCQLAVGHADSFETLSFVPIKRFNNREKCKKRSPKLGTPKLQQNHKKPGRQRVSVRKADTFFDSVLS